MSKERQEHLIKRKKVSVANFLMTAAIIGGCSLTNPQIENPTFTPTPIVEPAEIYPEIGLYYPILKSFSIQETGQINTERSSTKWFNLSPANFDPKLATRAIHYFEELASSRKNFFYQFSDDYDYIPLIPDKKPRTNRVIFLIPPQAPNPAWGQDVSWTASTTGIFKDGPYVSFVRIYNRQEDIPQSKVFITPDRANNKALTVEICQSIILMRSSTTEFANLGQEIFCNSWGAAFALKQYDLNYNQYLQWARNTSISANPQSPSYPLYILTKSDYQQIPKVVTIINN